MIRRATKDDLPDIMHIRTSVQENRQRDPSRATPEMVTWFLDGPGIWLWTEGDTVCGFAAGDPRDGKLWALFVDPPFQGRGIGGALLDQVCGLLVEAGNVELCLDTEPGTRAEAFYRARGWRGDAVNDRGELMLTRQIDKRRNA